MVWEELELLRLVFFFFSMKEFLSLSLSDQQQKIAEDSAGNESDENYIVTKKI
jgi:hypothetical protein